MAKVPSFLVFDVLKLLLAITRMESQFDKLLIVLRNVIHEQIDEQREWANNASLPSHELVDSFFVAVFKGVVHGRTPLTIELIHIKAVIKVMHQQLHIVRLSRDMQDFFHLEVFVAQVIVKGEKGPDV